MVSWYCIFVIQTLKPVADCPGQVIFSIDCQTLKVTCSTVCLEFRHLSLKIFCGQVHFCQHWQVLQITSNVVSLNLGVWSFIPCFQSADWNRWYICHSLQPFVQTLHLLFILCRYYELWYCGSLLKIFMHAALCNFCFNMFKWRFIFVCSMPKSHLVDLLALTNIQGDSFFHLASVNILIKYWVVYIRILTKGIMWRHIVDQSAEGV